MHAPYHQFPLSVITKHFLYYTSFNFPNTAHILVLALSIHNESKYPNNPTRQVTFSLPKYLASKQTILQYH